MVQIIQSEEKIRTNSYDIEAGDLANEVGKKFMKDLHKAIERNAAPGRSKLYFLTSIRKDPQELTKILLYIQPMHKPLYYKRESFDLWEYDYIKEKLNLIWSIPHRVEMKNFLRAPEKYNKDLIQWINEYLIQENINLNDNTSQVIA